jgi:hypothetical protein
MKEKALYWIPRIFTILAILFMMMFSIDVFSGNEPLSRKLVGFLVHNIPVWISICVLIIAWRWEIIGGVLYIISFITAAIFFKSFSSNPYSLIVIGPFLIMGILFILHDFLYGKRLVKESQSSAPNAVS